jgi:hypothetical protein
MCFLGLSSMSLGMRAASVQKDSRRTKLELSKDRDLGEMSQFVCLPSNTEWLEEHLSAVKKEVEGTITGGPKARTKERENIAIINIYNYHNMCNYCKHEYALGPLRF